ncbi:peroxidase 44-like [Senna tora]|uniref:Peroxidase n=1 Tax=Senna tora TaxID=362788 RepID=A0A834TBZ6_9FABA|nr:peroxidase 44-like [Senna tora]
MKASILFLIMSFLLPYAFAGLSPGFYSSSCSSAETIVQQIVQKSFARDKSITAAFLRMHFHDCFVRGCDASILIDPTKKKGSEKQAGPNLTVRGFEVIDEIKKALEKACPRTVSCADIITLATRDSVALAGGPKYEVSTGRLDGLLSDPNLVNLPGPSSTVSEALQFFTAKGMTLNEMVTLLGAHTVGFAHCSFFQDRLSSFGTRDPTMDLALDTQLGRECGTGRNDPTVFLDQNVNSSFVFDNDFYNQIINKRGVLFIDQQLALDNSSIGIVSAFAANAPSFQRSFANAMIKMGNLVERLGKIAGLLISLPSYLGN